MPVSVPNIDNALIIVCGIILLLIFLLFFFILLYRKSHNVFIREKELINARFSETLVRAQMEIQEQTLEKISFEIHDNIGQVLSVVRLHLNTMGSPVTDDKVERVDFYLGKAIADLRDLSHSLNTSYIKDIGLEQAVREELAPLEKTGKFSVAFSCACDCHGIGTDREVIIFRILQELLNNIIRHSGASEVVMQIWEEPAFFHFEVRDNGRGFDVAGAIAGHRGAGLKNLEKRAGMVGGSIAFDSGPGKGAHARLTIQKNMQNK